MSLRKLLVAAIVALPAGGCAMGPSCVQPNCGCDPASCTVLQEADCATFDEASAGSGRVVDDCYVEASPLPRGHRQFANGPAPRGWFGRLRAGHLFAGHDEPLEPSPTPAPAARFHPVPTRPVFEPCLDGFYAPSPEPLPIPAQP
jgi:hypothetical protein